MNHLQTKYGQIVNNFCNWAATQDNLRAIVIIGSQARASLPADDFSDLDVMAVANDPAVYLSTSDWLDNIGSYWLTFIEDSPSPGSKERRVLFAGGLDVDFVFNPTAMIEQFAKYGIPPEAAGIVSRGAQIVMDKDGLFRQMDFAAVEPPKFSRPGETEFTNLVNDFIYHYVWTVKKLGRGEIWTAHACLNGYMRWRLLTMIEWQARVLHGPDYDTWHEGRFLDNWADPKIIERLPRLFSAYDSRDTRRCLEEMMDLFRIIAMETAQKWGYPYPADADAQVKNWVQYHFK